MLRPKKIFKIGDEDISRKYLSLRSLIGKNVGVQRIFPEGGTGEKTRNEYSFTSEFIAKGKLELKKNEANKYELIIGNYSLTNEIRKIHSGKKFNYFYTGVAVFQL